MQEKIKEAGFESFEEYKSISKEENEINNLQREIEKYYQSVNAQKTMLEKMIVDTKTLTIQDIETYNTSLNELNANVY